MEIKQHKTKKPKWPAWFQDFYNNDYKPFQEQVIQKFDKIDDTLGQITQILSNIVKYNNLKTHE